MPMPTSFKLPFFFHLVMPGWVGGCRESGVGPRPRGLCFLPRQLKPIFLSFFPRRSGRFIRSVPPQAPEGSCMGAMPLAVQPLFYTILLSLGVSTMAFYSTWAGANMWSQVTTHSSPSLSALAVFHALQATSHAFPGHGPVYGRGSQPPLPSPAPHPPGHTEGTAPSGAHLQVTIDQLRCARVPAVPGAPLPVPAQPRARAPLRCASIRPCRLQR